MGYGETLKSIDLRKFNQNIIDPIKLTFDSNVYGKTFEQIIDDEIFRQRDKTNSNIIGYFHQNTLMIQLYPQITQYEADEHNLWEIHQ